MSTDHPHSANPPFPPAFTGAGQENAEQLFALADKIGAALSEASAQLQAAYNEAYQKLAQNPGGVSDGLTRAQQTVLRVITDPTSVNGQLEEAQDRAMVVSDGLTELGIEVSLAYLKALEDATLAVAKSQERVAAASQIDLVKATATTGAELLRKVAQAGAGTLREMAG
jgi:hypothetical protein